MAISLFRVLRLPGLVVALGMTQVLPAHAILPLCKPVSTAGYQQARQAQRLYEQNRHAEAVRRFRALAEAGNLFAQNQLALMYHRGLGVPRDYEAAAQWWRRAADHGQVTAQCNLGIMYMYGLGVKQDDVMSYLYLNAAAARGSRDARRKRDLLEAWRLTPSELKRAQALSRNWSPSP
jgi:TPR repeat protein